MPSSLSTPTSNERNSSVELVRILAIVFVVLTHAVPEAFDCAGQAFDYLSPTANPSFLVAGLLSGLGLVGDVLFLVISSWFLLDSKRVKANKVISMVTTVFIVSVLWYVVIIAIGFRPDTMTTVKQFFPTVFQNNWFISYYIVLYLIHPLLNAIIAKMSSRELAIAALLLGVLCFGVLWVAGVSLGVLKLLVFVAIYFGVAWLKFYGKRFCSTVSVNAVICACSAALYIAMRIAMNYIGLETGTMEGKMHLYVHINNPLIVAFGISVFNLANSRRFVSRTVNCLGSLSMLIYIIHRNNLFVEYLQSRYFDYVVATFGADALLVAIIVLAAIFFVGSTVLSLMYKYTLERVVNLFANRLGAALEKAYYKIKDKLKARFANAEKAPENTDLQEEEQKSVAPAPAESQKSAKKCGNVEPV